MPPSSKLIFKQVLKTDWCYKNEARGKKNLKLSPIVSRRRPTKHILKTGEKVE